MTDLSAPLRIPTTLDTGLVTSLCFCKRGTTLTGIMSISSLAPQTACLQGAQGAPLQQAVLTWQGSAGSMLHGHVTHAVLRKAPSALRERGQWRTRVTRSHQKINIKSFFWSINSCIFTATNKPGTDKHCTTAIPGKAKTRTILYPHSALEQMVNHSA